MFPDPSDMVPPPHDKFPTHNLNTNLFPADDLVSNPLVSSASAFPGFPEARYVPPSSAQLTGKSGEFPGPGVKPPGERSAINPLTDAQFEQAMAAGDIVHIIPTYHIYYIWRSIIFCEYFVE
jgi:hypothetical protein